MFQKITIIGNGNIAESTWDQIDPADFLICVDGAALELIKRGKIPDMALGDFDSVSEDEFSLIQKHSKKVVTYLSEKDETDLELAVIYSIGLAPTEVTILGATGRRLDHELANISFLKMYLDNDIKVSMIDPNNKITLIDKKTIIKKDKAYKYMSLLPFTENAVVTLSGCKYNISKRALTKISSLGVSNEIKGEVAEIDVHEGVLILIQSRD